MKPKTTKKSEAKRPVLGKFNGADLVKAAEGFARQVAAGTTHTLRTTTISLPPRLPVRSAAEVREVREKLGASQAVFAALLNVPLRTVSSWENDQRKPSGAALKLLDLAATHPEMFAVGTR